MGQEPTNELAEMRAALQAQQELIDSLRNRLDDIGQPAPQPGPEGSGTASRRGMLRLAVAGLGGAGAAVVAGAAPAAAADGDPLVVGQTKTVTPGSSMPTGLNVTGSIYARRSAFHVSDGEQPEGSAADGRAAILGYGAGGSVEDGVHGLSDAPWGAGLVGTGTDGVGTLSIGGPLGIMAIGDVYDVYAAGSGVIGSDIATVGLPPVAGDGTWAVGDLAHDDFTCWVCVFPGDPGIWRKIGSPATAGALHPISPIRVYDSRWAGQSKLTGGQTRPILVRDSKNDAGGTIQANAVPDGATAAVLNVTVAETTGGGFLKVYPGDAPAPAASAINWSASGQAVANGMTVKLDSLRRINVNCGAGSTHLIVDVTGYYR